ncbi:MAG: HU family DNA-binding protein [Rickettsiaceae bacterium]|nr:MAG: HU family DNA-binding protein [Rickettsiaceae bacterium]
MTTKTKTETKKHNKENSKDTSKAMSKSEFVGFIADHSSVAKQEAEKAVNLVIESVISALEQGRGINLIGFGSFQVQERQARKGRNPKTGEEMDIAAYSQPVFKAGKRMKEACNTK